ncbi:MAG: hypothetical protein AB7I57_25265 [Pirellulales bacterium]
MATNTGRQLVGNGIARLDGGDGFDINNGTPSKIAWLSAAQAFDGTTLTASSQAFTFDGTIVTATSPENSNVLTLTGTAPHVVQTYEAGDKITITGGSGFTTGTYTISSVNVGANQWTLSSNCTGGSAGAGLTGTGLIGTIQLTGYTVTNDDQLHTVDVTGGSGFTAGQKYQINSVVTGTPNRWILDRSPGSVGATGMTGTRKYTLWRDQGFGNVYRGLLFRGSPTFNGTETPTTRAAVLWQQRPQVAGVTPNTGKVVMENCSFANGDVGILFGKGLAQFGAAAQDYDGKADNNADHFHGENLNFQGVDTCVVVRNSQAVALQFTNMAVRVGCDTAFYVERGGKLNARGVWMTSGFANGPTLLRIGGGGGSPASTVGSPIVIDTAVFDAPSPNLKILEMDGTGNSNGDAQIKDAEISSTGVGTNLTLDGTLITASTSGASATITFGGSTGHTPIAGDTANILIITGGTNFIPGTYSVDSVSGSTWSLDRICSTDSATGLVGASVKGFYNRPIVTVKDGWHVTLDGVGPITPGSIRLDNAASLFKPSITLRNCILQIGEGEYLTPDVVIDKSGSTAGSEVRFEGCTTYGGRRKFCRDGVFVCDGAGGGVWRQGWVDPVP